MAQNVGVVGGGLMGSGIAYTAVLKSTASVTIVEQSEELLKGCRDRVEKLIQTGVKRGAIPEADAGKTRERIQFSTDLTSLRQAEIVVEAVFEDLGVKQKVFEQLDKICAPTAVLASNTSGISITGIAGSTSHPERVVGTHFFNPVPVMKLVELVRGSKTAENALSIARKFCEDLGKEVVVSSDRPGFITTRIGQAYICEALRCLEEEVGTAEDIDKGIRLAYNFPMGPLQLADLVGLDTELKIMESLQKELGSNRFDPGPILRRLVAEKKLGRKTGEGFFKYEPSAKS
jgi:3-hydroxybutyryl-CoA dehydrogenase